jgi:PAS domain S-box-containing protein
MYLSAPWSESLARMMFEQSPFSTVLYDSEGHLLAANEAFSTLWGVDVSSAPPGYSVLQDPELDRLGVLPIVRRAFDGEVVTTPPVCYDISKLSQQGVGEKRWTQGHFHPLLDEYGKVQVVVLTHIDLTEAVEAESRIRHALTDLESLQSLTASLATAITVDQVAEVALERARPAFGAGGGFVAIVDGDDFVVAGFEGFSAERMVPWSRFPISRPTSSHEAYVTGQAIFINSLEEAAARFPTVAEELRAGGYNSFATLPLRAHERVLGVVIFHFTAAGALEPSKKETMLAFAGQCALAMERALLYESERKARAEAELANRAKSEFLARMSHELRTPLNAIDGYAELLQLEIRGPLNEAQHNDLARIRRSQKHLLSLINDVLSFARLESGTLGFVLKDVDVAGAVSGAHDVVAPQMTAKGLVFKNRLSSDSLAVFADADKFEQILVNLLANAVKFTDAGTITVRARAVGTTVTIDVIDTGRGIPAHMLEEIFQPFVQVDTGMTRTSAGSGLGLAIARDLARRMDGDVVARSELGVGSTFTITLPLARSATSPEK